MPETPEDKKDFKDSSEFKKVFNFEGILIGFIIGAAVTATVSSFTTDILNPFIGVLVDDDKLLLEHYTITVYGSEFLYGSFLLQLIHLLILLGIVYVVYRFYRNHRS